MTAPRFRTQVAWLDEPDPASTPDNPDPKLDVSQWWKTLVSQGGQNKRDWREIRMKSTLKLPEPGTAPPAPAEETFADRLAVEAMQTEQQRDDLRSELALMRKENDNLRAELEAAQSAAVVAKGTLEKELTAQKTEVARLKTQLEEAGAGSDAGGGALLYFLIALVVVLLGLVGNLMLTADSAAGAGPPTQPAATDPD